LTHEIIRGYAMSVKMHWKLHFFTQKCIMWQLLSSVYKQQDCLIYALHNL